MGIDGSPWALEVGLPQGPIQGLAHSKQSVNVCGQKEGLSSTCFDGEESLSVSSDFHINLEWRQAGTLPPNISENIPENTIHASISTVTLGLDLVLAT